jgi:hypothetical protein
MAATENMISRPPKPVRPCMLTIQIMVNQCMEYHTIKIPVDALKKPSPITIRSEEKISKLFSNIYGLYRKANFFTEVIKAVRKIDAGRAISLSAPITGVPGVFSISSLPVVDHRGRVGFEVSGVLFDKIISIYAGTFKIFGNGMFYANTPAM